MKTALRTLVLTALLGCGSESDGVAANSNGTSTGTSAGTGTGTSSRTDSDEAGDTTIGEHGTDQGGPGSTTGVAASSSEGTSGAAEGPGDTGPAGPVCGNGRIEADEACDDGNLVDHDGCSNACRLPACGDGILHDGEACDDGNRSSSDACVECSAAVCGDGALWAGREACDGSLLGGATCMSEGFGSGTLLCTPACTLDTLACAPV